ncbi:MAG: hypothetical protein IT537_03835 [Hyphomicrobiales bacterium]|nr:hypothetical protein [Hyphomicrobiales bacterium]
MRFVVPAALALALPMMVGAPVAAQAPASLQNAQIEIVYVAPRNPAFQPIHDKLKKRQVLEELKQFLAPLKLPRKLTVQLDQCGAAARSYRTGGPATVCYELVEQIERVAAKASPNMREPVLVGTFIQAVLHEVALAVFDILQVPVWGRPHDAADMLSALLVLHFGEDVARQTIVGTAVFFEMSGRTWTGSAFATVSSPEAQRYFNFLCIAYGGAQKTFEFLVKAEEGKEPIMPQRRAARCEGEYQQVRKAFNLRIMPFVDPDLLVRVRAMPWVMPDDGRL